VTTELADDAARGNVPVENLPVGATGHQLRVIRGGVGVADLAGMGFVGLDVGAGVRVPKAEGAVLAAAQAVVAVEVEAHRKHCPFVPRQ